MPTPTEQKFEYFQKLQAVGVFQLDDLQYLKNLPLETVQRMVKTLIEIGIAVGETRAQKSVAAVDIGALIVEALRANPSKTVAIGGVPTDVLVKP